MDIPSALSEALRKAQRVAVLTGAGVSRESGIATFREAQTGLWAQYDPTELATPRAFGRNPQLVWEWYAWRRGLVGEARPNRGHLALVEMEGKVPQFTLITQNVDGMHRRAGSENIVELHGNITRNKCAEEDRIVEDWADSEETPPRCPHCGGLIRPDVVWFGESLPREALEEAIQAAQEAEVFLTVGTSAVVVEINPEETPFTPHASYALRGAAGEVLPQLVAQSWPT